MVRAAGALERVGLHLAKPPKDLPRECFWRIVAPHAVLASGALERPVAFENNDRPGIMMAGALRAYANRWGVKAGERVAVFTNNDDGLRTAADLKAKGVDVRPIKLAGGDSHVNEVFFDNVKVPAANLVGEKNKGWDVAKYLLAHERDMISGITITKEKNESTGHDETVVIEHKEDLHPQIIIEDENGNRLAINPVPEKAYIEVENGQRVVAGMLLATFKRAA